MVGTKADWAGMLWKGAKDGAVGDGGGSRGGARVAVGKAESCLECDRTNVF